MARSGVGMRAAAASGWRAAALLACALPSGRAGRRWSPSAAAAAPFRRHRACASGDYVLEWKGIDAATATLELTRDTAGDHWSYVSRNTARGIFRAVFHGRADAAEPTAASKTARSAR